MLEGPTNSPQGTDDGGFRILPGLGWHGLVIECWGYWEEDTIAVFLRQSQAALEKAASPLDFTLDAASLKPQSSAGQEAMRKFFRELAGKSLSRVGVRVENVLTRMQLMRLMRESGLESAQFTAPSNDAPPPGKS